MRLIIARASLRFIHALRRTLPNVFSGCGLQLMQGTPCRMGSEGCSEYFEGELTRAGALDANGSKSLHCCRLKP